MIPTVTSFITAPRYFHDIADKHKTLDKAAEADAERHRIKRELTGSRNLARIIEFEGIRQKVIADKHKRPKETALVPTSKAPFQKADRFCIKKSTKIWHLSNEVTGSAKPITTAPPSPTIS